MWVKGLEFGCGRQARLDAGRRARDLLYLSHLSRLSRFLSPDSKRHTEEALEGVVTCCLSLASLVRCAQATRLPGGLVFKAHRFLHHSTQGSQVLEKKKKASRQRGCRARLEGKASDVGFRVPGFGFRVSG